MLPVFESIIKEYKKSTAEEFILVPKKVYMKSHPYQTQVLEDPDVKHKSAQLSFINRMRSKEHSEAQINEKLPEEDSDVNVVDENWAENSNKIQIWAVKVLKTLSSLLPNSKYLKCENIVDLIKNLIVCPLMKTRSCSLTTVQLT